MNYLKNWLSPIVSPSVGTMLTSVSSNDSGDPTLLTNRFMGHSITHFITDHSKKKCKTNIFYTFFWDYFRKCAFTVVFFFHLHSWIVWWFHLGTPKNRRCNVNQNDRPLYGLNWPNAVKAYHEFQKRGVHMEWPRLWPKKSDQCYVDSTFIKELSVR